MALHFTRQPRRRSYDQVRSATSTSLGNGRPSHSSITRSSLGRMVLNHHFGAVFISQNPVHRNAFYHESLFKRWVRDNADNLMKHRRSEEIKDHGLTIVTDVYTGKK